MKIGYCLNMLATSKDITGCEQIPVIAKLGYDYVELPLVEMCMLTSEEQAKIKELMINSRISCEVCNNFFPQEVRLTGPAVDFGWIEDHAERALCLASSLGAKKVVFGSGTARNVPDGFSMFQAFDQLVKILSLVSDIAKKYEIIPVLEPARSPDTNIFHTYHSVWEWRKEAGANNAELLFDYFHVSSERDAQDGFSEFPDLLGHIHIACPRDKYGRERVCPSSEDGWDYSVLFSALKKNSYQSGISVEAYASNPALQAGNAIRFLKQMLF